MLKSESWLKQITSNFLFITLDDLRLKVWPKILNCDNLIQQNRIGDDTEKIEKHQYYNQVVMDVKRILKRFPPGMLVYNFKDFFLHPFKITTINFSGINEAIQADLQIKVTHLIVRVLIKNKELHYYQVMK